MDWHRASTPTIGSALRLSVSTLARAAGLAVRLESLASYTCAGSRGLALRSSRCAYAAERLRHSRMVVEVVSRRSAMLIRPHSDTDGTGKPSQASPTPSPSMSDWRKLLI